LGSNSGWKIQAIVEARKCFVHILDQKDKYPNFEQATGILPCFGTL